MDLSASYWSYLIPISLMSVMLIFPVFKWISKKTLKDAENNNK